MKSLQQQLEISDSEAIWQPLGKPRWDWSFVRRVLVVRLRSIGDTVLSTPALYALRKFLPHAQIDVLLEDWVAPLLDGFEHIDNVIIARRKDAVKDRIKLAHALRSNRYDVAYNLHGGTTATFLIRAAGARHRVGFKGYSAGFLYNHLAPSSSELWNRKKTHSVEQQLALLGWTGVPVSRKAQTQLAITAKAKASIEERLRAADFDAKQPFALIHPAAAFESKQWSTKNFARVVDELKARNIASIAVAAPQEKAVIEELKKEARAPVVSFSDLRLPEITALASLSKLFIGNDSGIAHIAAAVQTPCVVIFGSSNVSHWYPWTTAASEIVREDMPCAPCPGYTCSEFEKPQCIRRVTIEKVTGAIERVLNRNTKNGYKLETDITM